MNCAIVFPRYSNSLKVGIKDGKGTFKGKCRNYGKVCGFKAKECKKHKREFTVVAVMAKVRAIPIMVAQARLAIYAT